MGIVPESLYFIQLIITITMSNILVVDDDPSTVSLISYQLRKAGFYVMTANNAKEALDKDLDVVPDLIIIDKFMPGMDGFELVDILKSSPSTAYIRIIILTADDEPSAVIRGLDAGADDYVTKPFNPQILLARVRSQLRTKAVIDRLRREKKSS